MDICAAIHDNSASLLDERAEFFCDFVGPQRAAKNFNQLRAVAGIELAVLVAKKPEIVVVIAHKEAEDHGGTQLPRSANGIASWAQARPIPAPKHSNPS